MTDKQYTFHGEDEIYEVVADKEEKSIPTDGHARIAIPLDAVSMTAQFMRLIDELPWAGLSFIPGLPVDPDKIEEILANYQAYEARVNDILNVQAAFNAAFNRAKDSAIETRDHYIDELRERIIGIGFQARLPAEQYSEGYQQLSSGFRAEQAALRRREVDAQIPAGGYGGDD